MINPRGKYPEEGFYTTRQRAEEVAIQLCNNNQPLSFIVYHGGAGYYVKARGVAPPDELQFALTSFRMERSA